MAKSETINKGGRKKGTPKTGGRKKGTPNKVTTSMREWLTEIIDNNRDSIQNDLAALEPKERLIILEKFMQYTIPKMQSISADIDINSLSEAQIDLIVDKLTKSIDE